MTLDLSGVPYPSSAIEFDRALNRECGCNLAWQRERQMLVVVRDRGPNTPPRLYSVEFGRDQMPLRPDLLPSVIDCIRFTDGKADRDPVRMLSAMRRQEKEREQREQDTYIDDRLPDFLKDLKREIEVLTDGRRRTRFMDMGRRALLARRPNPVLLRSVPTPRTVLA
jgi:hypothetical protein